MPTAGKSPKEIVRTEMHKFKHGTLHSGSKKGPIVKNPAQAKAIAMSESGQSKYDRSSHHKGNPGFNRSETVKSPALKHSAIAEHESAKSPPKVKPDEGNGKREYGSVPSDLDHRDCCGFSPYKTGPNQAFTMPAAKGADGYRSAGHKRDGHLRLSGHSGAHRIGKKR